MKWRGGSREAGSGKGLCDEGTRWSVSLEQFRGQVQGVGGRWSTQRHPGITGWEVGLWEAGVSTGGKKMDSTCCSKMFAVKEKMVWVIV